MDELTLRRFLAILDAEQEERGDGLEIEADRYLALAEGKPPEAEERRLLLGSPLARELVEIAACLADAPGATQTQTQMGGMRVTLAMERLAAFSATGSDEAFTLDIGLAPNAAPCAKLTVRPGFGGQLAHLLSLRLEPSAWPDGYLDAEIAITLREPGPRGLIWLRGTTDEAGEISAAWPSGVPSPRQRLASLQGQELVIDVG